MLISTNHAYSAISPRSAASARFAEIWQTLVGPLERLGYMVQRHGCIGADASEKNDPMQDREIT
jgi:hypothetical protein